MVQYLSDEWMDEAGVALAAAPGLRDVAGDEPVVLQYEVTAAPGGKRSYGLRFADGTVTLDTGSHHKDADASFALDYDIRLRRSPGATCRPRRRSCRVA